MSYGAISKSSSQDEEKFIPEDGSIALPVSSFTTDPKPSSNKYLIGLGLFVVAAVSVAGLSALQTNLSSSTSGKNSALKVMRSSATDLETCSSKDVAVTASNEYGVFSAPYPFLENGEILVEPYKTTTLTLSGDMIDDAHDFTWSASFLEEDMTGSSIEVYTEKTGTNVLTITVSKSDETVCSVTIPTYVKYVKREMRTLTDADREKFLSAMAPMWSTKTLEGKIKYGSKYTSINDFVAEHSLASNDIMCDQFHEGSGFLTHHLALGMSFEASMRSIDPSVTMHYWDFTIEGETIYQAGKDPSHLLEITDMLSDTWFGSVDSDNHIQDSKFAHVLMPMVTDSQSSTRNSYGYIRSYWNNNPDEEVSRHLFDACGAEPVHKRIPYCKTHYDVLNSDDLAGVQTTSPSDGHGPMHVQFGGMWGGCTDYYNDFVEKWADVLDANMTNDDITDLGFEKWKWGNTAPRRLMFETAIMGEYFHIYRSLWRSHMCAADATPALLVCPESCDLDTSFDECSCQVDALVDGSTTWQNLYPCLLNDENQAYFNAAFSEEFLEELVNWIATAPVLEGEMIESASTADPLFWVIHPVIERLVQAKRLPGVTDMGGHEFVKWDVVDGSNETWLEYSYYTFKAGENLYYPDEYTCYGHAADDRVLPSALPYLDGVMEAADTNNDGIVSNIEFLAVLNPNDPELVDYVFDNFEWDHCTDMVV